MLLKFVLHRIVVLPDTEYLDSLPEYSARYLYIHETAIQAG